MQREFGNLEVRFGQRLRNPNNRLSEQFETCWAALASTFVIVLFTLSFNLWCSDTGGFRIPVDHMYGPIP
jgi:hypothetical protein